MNQINTLRASALTLFLLCHSLTAHGDDIFAVQSRLSTPNFQLFLELNDDASVNSSGPLFSPSGGIYGMTFLDDTAYAIELENVTFDDYLVTIPHEGPLVGQGSRVGANLIGFENVESLANVNGQLFATSLSFTGHMTTLITIDSTSGVGTAIGTGDTDVMIVGLAHDPSSNTLYGAGIPFGTLVDDPNLYSLDVETGATTLIGNTVEHIQSLTWHSEFGLIGAFERLYQIDTSTGAAVPIGDELFNDGVSDSFNGLYSLGSPVSIVAFECDLNADGICTIVDLDLLYAEPGLTDALITEWLSQASSVDALGRTFQLGDTDLNGAVDFTDFLTLSANFGSGPDTLWGMGNFNANGFVDFADFLALSGNFGFDSTMAQSVPEPMTSILLLIGIGFGTMHIRPKREKTNGRVGA